MIGMVNIIRLNHLAALHLHLVTEASNAEDMLVPDLAVLDGRLGVNGGPRSGHHRRLLDFSCGSA